MRALSKKKKNSLTAEQQTVHTRKAVHVNLKLLCILYNPPRMRSRLDPYRSCALLQRYVLGVSLHVNNLTHADALKIPILSEWVFTWNEYLTVTLYVFMEYRLQCK